MKSEEIQLYNTYNETKASVVERVIRTLKTRMWRYFTAKRTRRYIDVLQDLVGSYNKSKHRSIQKKPINVTQENEREVWHTLYGEPDKKGPPKYKFEIGDQVRISKMKRTFEKGYLPNFSKENFYSESTNTSRPSSIQIERLWARRIEWNVLQRGITKSYKRRRRVRGRKDFEKSWEKEKTRRCLSNG